MRNNIIYKTADNNLIFFIISVLLGILSSFSLPPYNLFFLNFISLPSLFILLQNKNKNAFKSFCVGWFFGFGYFFSNIYWINHSLTFDNTFKFLIPISLILIPSLLAIFYGLATLILYFFKLKNNFNSIFLFSAIFASTEFLRGIIFTGFPWNLIVYSISNYTNSLQILSYIGTYSLNLLCYTIFLTPIIYFMNIKFKIKAYSFFIIILLISSNSYFGSIKKKNFENTKDIINTNIKIVSPKIDIKRYFQNEDPTIMINEIVKLSDPKKNSNTLYILPEGILSGIYFKELKDYKDIFLRSFYKDENIILGTTINKNSNIYNSLVLMHSNLDVQSVYHKNDLVPFGEFLPLENFFHKLGIKKITQGYRSFSSSAKRDLINYKDFKILPLICYEIIYSGSLNKNKENYDFIVNISEDGWFGNSIGPYQHFSHSIFRSIEEGKNILRSSNNGISAHITPTGDVVNYLKSTESGVIEISSMKLKKNTFFFLNGNKIFFYFMLIYITLIFFLKRMKGIR